MAIVEIHDLGEGIVEVRLNRPDKRNAMSFEMMRLLVKTAKRLKKDRNLRAVILSGEGASFCAGIDLKDLRNPKNKRTMFFELISPWPNFVQNVSLVWRKLPVPVIAVIQGHCYGAGVQLALGADFRIATPQAELSIMEAKWGIIPDMGISAGIRGLIGTDKAKELAMTARVISGEEAAEIGLVSYIQEDPMKKALELAKELASRSPDAVALTKKLFQATTQYSEYRTLAMERLGQLRLLVSPNFSISAKKDKDPSISFKPRKWG